MHVLGTAAWFGEQATWWLTPTGAINVTTGREQHMERAFPSGAAFLRSPWAAASTHLATALQALTLGTAIVPAA
jgi:hypothetical protein